MAASAAARAVYAARDDALRIARAPLNFHHVLGRKLEGRLDLSKYQGLQPLHIEYNIGHYSRSFQLSSKIDQGKIEAALKDGVLSLTLPKVEEAKPRAINVR